MLIHILRGTPVVMWPLFAGLIALGLLQARTRTIGSRRATLLPGLWMLLSLAGVIGAFGPGAVALAAWTVGIVVAMATGPRLLPRIAATWHAAGDTLRVSGSWLPLSLIVGLFAVKYAASVSMAIQPRLATDTEFVVAFSLAYGVFSGLFAMRGLQLWQIRRAARA